MPCLKIKVNLLIFHYQKQLIPLAAGKHYNLTYFITLIAVATFTDHKYTTSHRKPYKMCYIVDFIMKSTKKTYTPRSSLCYISIRYHSYDTITFKIKNG